MDLMNGFMADMKAGPAWVYYWVLFMGFMFMLSIPFSLKNKQARVILLATLVFAPMVMMAVYAKFGYERILGLGHILAWTPALYYLYKTRSDWRGNTGIVSKWLTVTLVVMCISLVFDVSDVVRYALGARS